ncbi:YybH family protein [Alteraurantiacibacter aquimixticola]|uniref:Nuclear transport factor 2 family protein n=1 Tax=Alteraurantiacibacter aquimixticola TaxID=2489173 RepID=A0A4T3EWG3_9SPHN|nr:nuclear transport factor 2 family protein [Alteraurantiacibacter aquimixticola]TIX48803.1 nuclear transport factor 2 family protein [Alteraurantiacibacter aquimixticola]
MKKLHLAALAPVLMLAACGSGVDPQESVDAIRQTELSQLQSIESKDLVGIARLYRDDAVLVKPDGTVLEGGVAIVDEYAALLEDPNFSIAIEPQEGWGSEGGDLAVIDSLVNFTTSDPETGEPVTLPMTSQTVWHRETGSTWKIISAYNVALAEESAADDGAEAEAAE